MITGDQLRVARKRLGLSLTTAAEAASVSRRTFTRWQASGILSRCIERKVARLLWNATRMHSYQQVCDKCCGSGLLPQPGAPEVLPRIQRLRSDEPGSICE
jgi:transcriptional regulator with XRE-family HTH domain